MALEWNFWYARWMIDDGLPNRGVGDEFAWAIEFSTSERLLRANEQQKAAVPRPDYKYRVVAQVRSVRPNVSQ
jgi:hypothetical protein